MNGKVIVVALAAVTLTAWFTDSFRHQGVAAGMLIRTQLQAPSFVYPPPSHYRGDAPLVGAFELPPGHPPIGGREDGVGEYGRPPGTPLPKIYRI